MNTILITGASSGLGEALAKSYAGPGVRLYLAGRDAARLEGVAQACHGLGAEVEARTIDVADRSAMMQWLIETWECQPLDIVIANAGVSAGTGSQLGETADQARAIFASNLDGVLNTILPVIEPMRRRRAGQIVIMASLAGFRGLPSAPAYSASKAAVRVWGEGLRGWLAKDGVGVTVVCPGFVATPMTARNRFPMPFLMTADAAAGLIRRAIAKNRGRVAFPWPMAAMIWLLAGLPPGWTDAVLSRLPGKD